MTEGWRYVVTRQAARDLERLSVDVRRRILEALDRFVADPGRTRQRKLGGRTDEWRLRVGDWRVRYRPDFGSRVIVVLRVLPRGRAYREE